MIFGHVAVILKHIWTKPTKEARVLSWSAAQYKSWLLFLKFPITIGRRSCGCINGYGIVLTGAVYRRVLCTTKHTAALRKNTAKLFLQNVCGVSLVFVYKSCETSNLILQSTILNPICNYEFFFVVLFHVLEVICMLEKNFWGGLHRNGPNG